MTRRGLPHLGYGVGLRAAHYGHLRHTPADQWGVDWFELMTEDFLHGRSRAIAEYIAAARPIALHGISLNIGSTDPLDTDYLHALASLAKVLRPAWISDHLCWTGVNGINSHDLWPVPLTRRCLAHIAGRVRVVQDALGRPLILENPSSYVEWSATEMPEHEFLAQLAEATGCGLLLDVNNVYVSAANHGWDPVTYIEALPADRITYVHLAGHSDCGTHLLDTHDRPVADAVWPLYALAQQRTGGVATLLEWDADIPSWPALLHELGKAAAYG